MKNRTLFRLLARRPYLSVSSKYAKFRFLETPVIMLQLSVILALMFIFVLIVLNFNWLMNIPLIVAVIAIPVSLIVCICLSAFMFTVIFNPQEFLEQRDSIIRDTNTVLFVASKHLRKFKNSDELKMATILIYQMEARNELSVTSSKLDLEVEAINEFEQDAVYGNNAEVSNFYDDSAYYVARIFIMRLINSQTLRSKVAILMIKPENINTASAFVNVLKSQNLIEQFFQPSNEERKIVRQLTQDLWNLSDEDHTLQKRQQNAEKQLAKQQQKEKAERQIRSFFGK